jgi:hypothetical protein
MNEISYVQIVPTLTLIAAVAAAIVPFLSAKYMSSATIKASEIAKEAVKENHKWELANRNLKHLAENVSFYHDLEAEYLNELSKFTGKSTNALKQSFRKQVKDHPAEGILSSAAAKGVLGSMHQPHKGSAN